MSAPAWTTALRDCAFCQQPPRFYVRPATPNIPGFEFLAFVGCLCSGYGNANAGVGATAADAERQAADAWNKRAGGAE